MDDGAGENRRLWDAGLQEAEAATVAVCAGDFDPLTRWGDDNDYPKPKLAWGDDIGKALAQAGQPTSFGSSEPGGAVSPAETPPTFPQALPAISLNGLLDWYRALPTKPGKLPLKGQIRPDELTGYLGHLLMMDVVDNGRDFHYRLYGSEVARVARMDPTRRLLSAIAPRTPTVFIYRVTYMAVARRGDPLFCDHYTQPYLSAERWQRLILPFATPEAPDGVGYLLVGKVPYGYRAEAEADAQYVDW